MKKYLLPMALLTTITLLAGACVKDRIIGKITPPPVNTGNDTLIHYWNCNEDTLTIMGTPTQSIVAGASLSYGGIRFDTVQNGTNLNAVGDDTLAIAGTAALRLRNPSGPFVLSLPTTGYKDLILKYAVARSSKGAATNTVTYTTDGTNYINTAIAASGVYAVDTLYSLITLDFSSDASVNNNPNFKVKINFSNATGTTTGNDRFDNITLYGIKQ